MKFCRRNSIPFWLYALGYFILFIVLAFFFITTILFLGFLISTGTMQETLDIFRYKFVSVIWVFILYAFYIAFKFISNLIIDEIDSVEIDENKRTISFNYSLKDVYKSQTSITFSIDDSMFKYNSKYNNGLKVAMLCLIIPPLSKNNPMGFHLRFVQTEKPNSNCYDEIILLANCGWTKEQLEEILVELGKFKEEEDYYYGAKPKRKRMNTKTINE